MAATNPIDVRRYDSVVRIFLEQPGVEFDQVAEQTGVAEHTVRKIWDGTISRPPVILLDRLSQPKRCPECGALCQDWPCVLCTMQERSLKTFRRHTRFMYRNQSK